MQKRRISIITTALLTVITIFCSLSFAQDQGQALIDAAGQGKLETVKDLLSNGADVNSKDKKGMAALMNASIKGHPEIVKVLLDEGADVNANDKNGPTALELASLHPEVVKLLKAHGAKETGPSQSLSDEPLTPAESVKAADIWGIAVLLLIAFALTLFSRIAGTRRMRRMFLGLGLAVWFVVLFWFLPPKNYASSALIGFIILSGSISDLIARPILKRRLTPPCVSVRPTGIYKTVSAFFWIVLIAFGILLVTKSFGSSAKMLFPGLLTASMIIYLMLNLSERVEICGAGVCQYGWLRPWDEYVLRPWDEYESFYWEGKTKDSFELRLVSKSWGSDRLLVAPEDREAVQTLLEANLPDLTNEDELVKLGLPPRSRQRNAAAVLLDNGAGAFASDTDSLS